MKLGLKKKVQHTLSKRYYIDVVTEFKKKVLNIYFENIAIRTLHH